MSSRSPWVPDDVADEDIARWSETLGGKLAEIEWRAKESGSVGMLTRLDQLRAKLSDRRNRVLRRHFGGES